MERGTVRVCLLAGTRENIAPISGCRVSKYAQRVITPVNPLRSCGCPVRSSAPPAFVFSSPDGLHFVFLNRLQPAQPRLHPCDAHFSWRVSRDEEIRFAPRENGVIIYGGGGGGWRAGVNHNVVAVVAPPSSLAFAKSALERTPGDLFLFSFLPSSLSSLLPVSGRDENLEKG